MGYDVDFRENPCAAVDTMYPLTAKGANTPGDFVVPADVSRITAIRIYVSGIATDVVTGSTCAVHLYGGGIKLGYGWFVGPLISLAGAAATSGGYEFREAMIYSTNIPVTPGGTFSADGVFNGEDLGTPHMLVLIEYDGNPGKITDMDYREDDIGAAANTPVALTHRGAAVESGGFRPIGTIGEIVVGAALDPTGDAAAGLVFAPEITLAGTGLVRSGYYTFLGPAGPTQPDTDVAGNQQCIQNPSRYLCGNGIQTKLSGIIDATGQNIESINPGHAIVGLCYY